MKKIFFSFSNQLWFSSSGAGSSLRRFGQSIKRRRRNLFLFSFLLFHINYDSLCLRQKAVWDMENNENKFVFFFSQINYDSLCLGQELAWGGLDRALKGEGGMNKIFFYFHFCCFKSIMILYVWDRKQSKTWNKMETNLFFFLSQINYDSLRLGQEVAWGDLDRALKGSSGRWSNKSQVMGVLKTLSRMISDTS